MHRRESRGCFTGKQPLAAAGLRSSGRPAWGENKAERQPGRNAQGKRWESRGSDKEERGETDKEKADKGTLGKEA